MPWRCNTAPDSGVNGLVLPNWLTASEISIPSVDIVVSLVLYEPPQGEADLAVHQVLRSDLSVHVIVVDNSKVPAMLFYEGDPRVTVIRTPQNLGYGKGHNLAIALGRQASNFHLIANTDLELPSSTIGALVNLMKADASVGLIAPQVIYPDGSRQANARLIPAPWDLIAKRMPFKNRAMRRRYERFLLTNWDHDRRADIPFLTGCFMLFRTSVLERLGGFDPRFFVFGEDVDLSRRAHRLTRTLFVPDVVVTHASRTESQPSMRLIALLAIGYMRYFNKWGWIRDAERETLNRTAIQRLEASL